MDAVLIFAFAVWGVTLIEVGREVGARWRYWSLAGASYRYKFRRVRGPLLFFLLLASVGAACLKLY